MIEILPADSGEMFREFLEFPYTLYRDNPHWVPQLNRDIKALFSKDNPFFEHAEVQPFIARKNGSTAGRITAIYNTTYTDYYNEPVGFFGFFDCIDDLEVARSLIDAVKNWLVSRNMTSMMGPMNFSSNEEIGVLFEGFDEPPMIMMPYNHPYYDRLYKECGFERVRDLFAYIADVPDSFPEKVYRVARISEKKGVSVRPIRMKHFAQEMEIFREIYNSAWEKNWGFMPMTANEINHAAKELKSIVVPDLTLIAEHNGEAVGFMMFLPDFNYVLKKLDGRLLPFGIFKALWHTRKITDARLLLLGIKPGFRRRGVDSLLFLKGLEGLKKHGYKRMEFSWILEDNHDVKRVIETMNGDLYKKYRVYQCSI
ncbi:MAG: GNAT family N-acetyltransferase [Nitrospira sp.]|nr:GNAT family N-acetyltransferase [bacterium]MBL7049185.1 GNAT family N-acetyltransferase [Nitrospira sp.]